MTNPRYYHHGSQFTINEYSKCHVLKNHPLGKVMIYAIAIERLEVLQPLNFNYEIPQILPPLQIPPNVIFITDLLSLHLEHINSLFIPIRYLVFPLPAD